jgi:hypothetical protein
MIFTVIGLGQIPSDQRLRAATFRAPKQAGAEPLLHEIEPARTEPSVLHSSAPAAVSSGRNGASYSRRKEEQDVEVFDARHHAASWADAVSFRADNACGDLKRMIEPHTAPGINEVLSSTLHYANQQEPVGVSAVFARRSPCRGEKALKLAQCVDPHFFQIDLANWSKPRGRARSNGVHVGS